VIDSSQVGEESGRHSSSRLFGEIDAPLLHEVDTRGLCAMTPKIFDNAKQLLDDLWMLCAS
jgi:hypothetical protein